MNHPLRYCVGRAIRLTQIWGFPALLRGTMAGGFAMISTAIFILLGLIILAVFGLAKLAYDLKINALKESKILFDEHFDALDRFIKDPASPVALVSAALTISGTANQASFGKFATETIMSDKISDETVADQRSLEIIRQLSELESHRPDLVKEFNKVMSSALLGSVYRHIANEISPVRAYSEAKAAAEAKSKSQSSTTSKAVLSHDLLGWCEAA